jgi:hypothetical protein
MNDFANTRAALVEWEKDDARVDALLRQAHTQAEVDAAFAFEDRAKERLALAFWRDTKEYNSLANCRLVSPRELMKLCKMEKTS